VAEVTIRRHIRHKSATIMRRYDRRAGSTTPHSFSAPRPPKSRPSVTVIGVEAGRHVTSRRHAPPRRLAMARSYLVRAFLRSHTGDDGTFR
jgi:hypothetical protein